MDVLSKIASTYQASHIEIRSKSRQDKRLQLEQIEVLPEGKTVR